MKIRSATALGTLTWGPVALGLSALLLGGTAIGVTGAGMAAASARDQSRAEKTARNDAAIAQKALGAGNIRVAIDRAEAAVSWQPQAAAYRMLLGQSYLKGGRFASARDAFADTLALDDHDGRAALHFALMQIATGDWAGARKTLDSHADTIQVADRGLGIALAGDPAGAVELLAPAAREPGSDAKLRQNLALSLALAGRWQEAKTVVAIDVAPDQVDARIMEWAAFSRPKSASDQVAALLGVTPAVDPGQPAALALNGAVHGGSALAAADPVDAYMPGTPAAPAQPAMAQPAMADAAPVALAPVDVAAAAPSIAGVVFAERREVVQPLPVAVAVAPRERIKVAKTASVRLAATEQLVTVPAPTGRAAKGKFYVQVGAYQNAAVARDAWARASRFDGFDGHAPQGMSIKTAAGSFYRLSVGGFARGDAVSMCMAYRAKGGTCFVRAGAGDQVAMWAKGRELASR